MVIYWGLLIWVFVIGQQQPDDRNPLKSNDAKPYYADWRMAVLLMLPIVFFAVFRSAPIDTGSYIRGFNSVPTNMDYFEEYWQSKADSQLYYALQMLFKCYISDSPTMWLGLIAILQGVLLTVTFRKYSVNMPMTVYIFVGSTLFTWMYNGIRQFIVVTIMFALADCIIKNKWYIYLPVTLLLCGLNPIYEIFGWGTPPWYLCGVHQSALLLIPIFFIVQGKLLNWRVWLFAAVFAVLIMVGGMDSLVESAAENTTYSVDIENAQADEGASPFRAIVALVPLAMAFMKRAEIAQMRDVPPIIPLCINMSVVTFALHVASVFTSGIYVGRLPVYTELFNLILIPWLIMEPYKNDKQMLSKTVYGAYFLWFVYQMHIAWESLSYASDVLHLYFWGGTL